MKNSIDHLIKNRRATPARFLATKDISKDLIKRILENANWAPNHKKTEPWRFKVYLGKSKKQLAKQISNILDQKAGEGEEINIQKKEKFIEALERVPLVIAIILERDVAQRIPEWEEIAAVSMSVQNMWLTATELGLGAFWATPQFMPYIADIFDLKLNQKLHGFFYVGEIAMDYPSPGRGDINDKVEWNE